MWQHNISDITTDLDMSFSNESPINHQLFELVKHS